MLEGAEREGKEGADMCCLVREGEIGETCAWRKKTCGGGKSTREASLLDLDAENSLNGEETVWKVAVRRVFGSETSD